MSINNILNLKKYNSTRYKEIELKNSEILSFLSQFYQNIDFYCSRYYNNDVVFRYHLAKARIGHRFMAWIIEYKNGKRKSAQLDCMLILAKLLKLPLGVLLFSDLKELVLKNVISKDDKKFHFIIQPNYVTDGVYFYSKARGDYLPIGCKFLSQFSDIKSFQAYTLNDKYFDMIDNQLP